MSATMEFTATRASSGPGRRADGRCMFCRWIVFLALTGLIAAMLPAGPAEAGWLRPLTGAGNFYFHCDLVTLSRDDGTHDSGVVCQGQEVVALAEVHAALDARAPREVELVVARSGADADARSDGAPDVGRCHDGAGIPDHVVAFTRIDRDG